MAETIRQLIIANVVHTIEGMPSVAGCDYDKPFDHTHPQMPHGWVFDLDEQFGFDQSTNDMFNTLRVEVLIAYVYDAASGFRTRGNELLGEVLHAMLADEGRGFDPVTHAKLAFNTTPDSANIGFVPDRNVAALTTTWEIQYHCKRQNPYER